QSGGRDRDDGDRRPDAPEHGIRRLEGQACDTLQALLRESASPTKTWNAPVSDRLGLLERHLRGRMTEDRVSEPTGVVATQPQQEIAAGAIEHHELELQLGTDETMLGQALEILDGRGLQPTHDRVQIVLQHRHRLAEQRTVRRKESRPFEALADDDLE